MTDEQREGISYPPDNSDAAEEPEHNEQDPFANVGSNSTLVPEETCASIMKEVALNRRSIDVSRAVQQMKDNSQDGVLSAKLNEAAEAEVVQLGKFYDRCLVILRSMVGKVKLYNPKLWGKLNIGIEQADRIINSREFML